MHGFIDSLNPLFSRYKSEVLLLSCAIVICIVSLTLFLQQQNNEEKTATIKTTSETHTLPQKQTITIDVSGAVKRPFVYTFSKNSRIIDAIAQAGGLTDEADVAFVQRNINYARVLSDQEKIYIPFLAETSNGVVLENKRIIDYTQPNISNSQTAPSIRININSASTTELDQLPGVGKITADAIFNARPYTSINELIERSVLKQSAYDKVKDLISVY